MKKHCILIFLIFITLFTTYGCYNATQMDSNTENNESADSEFLEMDTVYKNKKNDYKLVANSDGSFILYIENKNPLTAVGGKWVKNGFLVDFEYVECFNQKYIFTRKVNKNIQENFTFINYEWVKDTKLSPEKIYEEKINIFKTSGLPEDYMVVDNKLSDEEILTNSVLQLGGTAVGATYSNIFIFSEDNTFRYYCSGFGSETKESAENYKKRVNNFVLYL